MRYFCWSCRWGKHQKWDEKLFQSRGRVWPTAQNLTTEAAALWKQPLAQKPLTKIKPFPYSSFAQHQAAVATLKTQNDTACKITAAKYGDFAHVQSRSTEPGTPVKDRWAQESKTRAKITFKRCRISRDSLSPSLSSVETIPESASELSMPESDQCGNLSGQDGTNFCQMSRTVAVGKRLYKHLE